MADEFFLAGRDENGNLVTSPFPYNTATGIVELPVGPSNGWRLQGPLVPTNPFVNFPTLGPVNLPTGDQQIRYLAIRDVPAGFAINSLVTYASNFDPGYVPINPLSTFSIPMISQSNDMTLTIGQRNTWQSIVFNNPIMMSRYHRWGAGVDFPLGFPSPDDVAATWRGTVVYASDYVAGVYENFDCTTNEDMITIKTKGEVYIDWERYLMLRNQLRSMTLNLKCVDHASLDISWGLWEGPVLGFTEVSCLRRQGLANLNFLCTHSGQPTIDEDTGYGNDGFNWQTQFGTFSDNTTYHVYPATTQYNDGRPIPIYSRNIGGTVDTNSIKRRPFIRLASLNPGVDEVEVQIAKWEWIRS